MRKAVLILGLILSGQVLFAQDKAGADKLVEEGIVDHDKGKYQEALTKYDKALELDQDNLFALAEKGMTLMSLQQYQEAITYCKRAIEKHPGDKALTNVYVMSGNAYDALKQPDQAIEQYNQGLTLFPDYYHLYYNKGVTLARTEKFDDAVVCFQKAVAANPRHASSHNAVARMSYNKVKRIPSILAYSRFLILEQESKRAQENLASLKELMNSNVEKTGKKAITINVNSALLADTTSDGKPLENNFSTTDLILSMNAALDYDKKYKKNTEVENFARKFEAICSSLKETNKDNYGFYWEYYAPYFAEMKDKNLVQTFSYLAFAPSGDASVIKWLKTHQSDIDRFYEWSNSYKW